MNTFDDALYMNSYGTHLDSSVLAVCYSTEESKKNYSYRIEIENHISPFITKDAVKELARVLEKAITKAEDFCCGGAKSRKLWATKCKNCCATIVVLTNGTIDISYDFFKHHWHLNRTCVREVVDILEAALEVTK